MTRSAVAAWVLVAVVTASCTTAPEVFPDRYSDTCPPEKLPESDEWFDFGDAKEEPEPTPPVWFSDVTATDIEEQFEYSNELAVGRSQAWWTQPDYLTEVGFPESIEVPDDPIILPTGLRPKTLFESSLAEMYLDVRGDEVLGILWEAVLTDRIVQVDLCEDLSLLLLVGTDKSAYENRPRDQWVDYSHLSVAGAAYDRDGVRLGAFMGSSEMDDTYGSAEFRHLQVLLKIGLRNLVIRMGARTSSESTGTASFEGINTDGIR